MREAGEALEVDFQRFYRLDLLDLWRGRITPRKAAVLARNLPAGATTWAALDSPAAWTTEAHLAALQADAIQIANWQRGGGQGERPKRIPRPGDSRVSDMKKAAVAARAARFAARQQAKR